MNHLKYIRGINVPRRAPSNAALLSRYGQHTDHHQFRSQLSGPNPSFEAKKNYGIGIKYSGQFRQDGLRLISKESKTICKQRNRTKSSVTSLKKKSSMDKKPPLESITRTVCHYSTCQNVKFNSSGINKRHMSQNIVIMSGAKNINRHSSFVASVEKQPRSYAEMIADYSEALYKGSTVGIRNDSLDFNNTIRRCPFSTFSTPSSVKKIVNFAEHSEVLTEGQKDLSLPADAVKTFDRHDNINAVGCHDSRHRDTCTTEAMNKIIEQNCIITNDLRDNDQSYAKLVANCDKSMRNMCFANISNGGLVPTRNVLARNSLESFATPTRKVSSTNTQETLREISPVATTMPLEKNIKRQMIDLEKNDWLREIENVTCDLKSVTERKTVLKLKGSDILQPAKASDNFVAGVHRLTKLIEAHERKKKTTIVRKLSCQSDKIDKMEKHKRDFELQKHNYAQLNDKISSDLSRYFSNTASNSSAKKNSTHAPTSGSTGVSKQPQIKLRMVPSEKESVVSINVDSTGLLDRSSPTSKQLSVVVQSDQKEDPQSMENQWNAPSLRHNTKSASQRSDFGSMRISISEDSAPVKQIEFSINGKPVSELKSITARTERLDVVSSMDKIEIRIPFVKDDSNVLSKIGESDLSKEIDSSAGQILNVQISANFQNESTKGTVEGPTKTIRHHYNKNTVPISSSPISKTNYLFNDSMETREETFNNNHMQYEAFKRMGIKSGNMSDKRINEHKISSDIDLERNATKNQSIDKTMTDASLIKETDNSEVESLSMKKMTKVTRIPETNKYDKNESSDHRVPSKMIPWWSSSDSFNKIRKKEDDLKPLVPPSSRNKKKAISNSNKNLVTDFSLLKSKNTSSSKTLTKKTQPMNNNLISYSNSVEQRVESKPILHYLYPFRSSPNQENPPIIIPEIKKNDLKTGDNQMSTTKKSNKKKSEIKQTKLVTLSTFDTTNIQREHEISIKERIPQRKIKMPSSAQNSPSQRNREKKDNYSLKKTKSIDDIPNKLKIENILDTIKPIEKKKDGTLIDYGLKMSSRKSTVKLDSRVKETQASPPVIMKTKNLMSTTEMTPRREQLTKLMLARQTELNKTKKLEIKTDVLKEKEDLTAKNFATTDIEMQNKDDVKNIKQMHKTNIMTSSFSNFRNSSKLAQTLKKEKLAENTIVQDNSKPNLNSLSVLQESEKLKSLTFSKLENNPSKESSDIKVIDRKKSLNIINEIQTKFNRNNVADINKLSSSQIKSNPISKIKDSAVSKIPMNKNMEKMPDRSVKKLNKKINVEDTIVKIITQNPKDPLSKDGEENRLAKSKLSKDKRNSSGSAGSSRKPSGSTGFKSTDSNMKSRVMSNNSCTYAGKLLFMESLYSNNRKDDTIHSNPQPAIFKISRNLNNVDDTLEHHVPNVTESLWTDRPEKNILYSAWLQRSRNDINQNEKLL